MGSAGIAKVLFSDPSRMVLLSHSLPIDVFEKTYVADRLNIPYTEACEHSSMKEVRYFV
jgi:hypothetical protein